MTVADALPMLIDGRPRWTAGRLAVQNPATLAIVAEAPVASRGDVDDAVAASRAAWPGWAATSMADRRAALRAMAALLLADIGAMAPLLTAEQGKTLAEAEREVRSASAWLSGTADLDPPDETGIGPDGLQRSVRHLPLGVVGAIAPWNYPLLLGMIKVAPALLAGNCVVLKPSPVTPLTSLRLGLLVGALLPAGVLNILSGNDELGPWLTSHIDVDKIGFTGSTATGRQVMASAAPTLKRLTLELGGNDAAIVLPGTDLDAVAPLIFRSAFRNAGQVCIATKRLFVHESLYARLRDQLHALATASVVGDGACERTSMGPLATARQRAFVAQLAADAAARGSRLLAGTAPDGPGHFLPVTLVDDPPDDAAVVAEEQFGPILPLLRFSDDREVVARANGSPLGLGCSIWGPDDRAEAIAGQMAAGTVWVNEAPTLIPSAAFGGWRQSGIGTEGGADGLSSYMARRVMVCKQSKPKAGVADSACG
jgi:acyl-CoA reductase-like NAD-dependent aldehyde dehydrogenase